MFLRQEGLRWKSRKPGEDRKQQIQRGWILSSILTPIGCREIRNPIGDDHRLFTVSHAVESPLKVPVLIPNRRAKYQNILTDKPSLFEYSMGAT